MNDSFIPGNLELSLQRRETHWTDSETDTGHKTGISDIAAGKDNAINGTSDHVNQVYLHHLVD